MGDLISREAVLNMRRRMVEYDESGCGVTMAAVAVDDINALSTVDAEPVRRSRWHYHGDGYYFCGECKKYIVCIGGDADLNYCPNCGAKMEGGSKA